CRHEVLLFQILDPAELQFGFSDAIMFQDIETGRDLYVDPGAIRKEYLKRLQAHNDAVSAICDKLGIGYYRFATDRPLELTLFDFLRLQMHRGKNVRRPAGTRANR